MVDRTFATPTLGLELTSVNLKGALLSFTAGKITLERTFEISKEMTQVDESHVKLLYTGDDEQALINAIEKSLPVTSLNTSQVLIRPLKLVLKKTKAVDQVLDFETEPLLPFPIDQAIYDRLILTQTEEGTELSILATKNEEVLHHLEQMEEISIDPEIISCTPFALAVFANQCIEMIKPVIVLNINFDEIAACLVTNRKVLAVYSSNNSLKLLFDLFSKENSPEKMAAFKTLDFSNIQDESLKQGIDTLNLEIKKLLYSLSKHPKGEGVNQILITGDVTELEGLISLEDKEILTVDETQILGATKQTLLKNALCIGLALCALPNAREQINFRQKEFSYPRPFKRLIKPIALYFTLSILSALMLSFFGQIYVSSKEANIKKKYLELLASMGKTHEQFENEFKEKNPNSLIKSPRELTETDLYSRIYFIEDKIKSTPSVYPLYPNVPKVADVLAWLSNHPLIAGDEPKIKLESFNYKMVKYPERNRPQEKYQVKVEIEFTATTPRTAREFHDALLASNDLIDQNFEIKWNADREKYRTSFTLKDKTYYPSLR